MYTGRKVDESSSPRQKMIKALVGFTQYQSVARKQAAVNNRPLGMFLHDLCVANGASRTLLNVLAGLCLMPWPNNMDKVTDAFNKTEAEALHGVLNPDARASQQMVLGRRLTSFAYAAGARASDGTSTGASASASADASAGALASASASASACASSASTDALVPNTLGGGGSGPASAVCLPAGVLKDRISKSATGLHFPSDGASTGALASASAGASDGASASASTGASTGASSDAVMLDIQPDADAVGEPGSAHPPSRQSKRDRSVSRGLDFCRLVTGHCLNKHPLVERVGHQRLTCDNCSEQIMKDMLRYSCAACDYDKCANCVSIAQSSAKLPTKSLPPNMHIKTPAAVAQAHVGTIDKALVPPAPAVGTPPFGSVCVTCCRYYDNANTHNTKGGEIHRVHDNHVQNDVTVGVGVLPNAPLPAQLDSHIPEYLHIARREALSRAKLVARYQDGEANATATSAECEEVRALAAATAAGWVPFANLSDVPAECYALQPGALEWRLGALPPNVGEAAKLQVSVLRSKLQAQWRKYQLRVNASQGKPTIRSLGGVMPLGERGALETALSMQSVQSHEVVSMHFASPLSLSKLNLANGAGLLWEPKRWIQCAKLLGDDQWRGPDQMDAVAAQIRTGVSVSDLDPDYLVVIITAEREQVISGLHGGVGADPNQVAGKRRISTLCVPPFAAAERWLMPMPKLERVLVTVHDYPEVARPAIFEALPTVMADSCTNVGMAQVIKADVKLWGLPYARIFDIRRTGCDDGVQIFGGDQNTLRGYDSVLAGYSLAITACRRQLDGMEQSDPAFWNIIDHLMRSIQGYKEIKAYIKKIGHLHFGMHTFKVIAATWLGPLLGTLRVLLVVKNIDVGASNYAAWTDFGAVAEDALYHSLFDQMRADGQYPTRSFVSDTDHESGVNIEGALEHLGCYIEGKRDAGDAVTTCSLALMRALHEAETLYTSIRHDDKPYVDSVTMPFWLPVFRRSNKFLYAQLCAQQMSEVYTLSEGLRRACRQLFVHAQKGSMRATLLDISLEEVRKLLKKREGDYINERWVRASTRLLLHRRIACIADC